MLVDFIKTEFGIEHLEYLGDGLFEMDENTFKFFMNVDGETISYLVDYIVTGWQEIEQKKKNKQ